MKNKSAWDDSLPEKGRQACFRASREEAEAAIAHATQFLETLPYKGERLTDRQALSWPRKGVFRDDGAPITGVPHEIKEAASMVAGFILAKIPFDIPAVAWVMATIGHLLKDDFDLGKSDITWH